MSVIAIGYAVYKSLYIIMLYRSCITSSTQIVMVWIIGQSFFPVGWSDSTLKVSGRMAGRHFQCMTIDEYAVLHV